MPDAFPVPEVRQSVMEKLRRALPAVPAGGAKVRRWQMTHPDTHERALAGGICFKPQECLAELQETGLTPEAFANQDCKTVYATALRLAAENAPLSSAALKLASGLSQATFEALLEVGCLSGEARFYADQIKAADTFKRAVKMFTDAQGTGLEGLRLALDQIKASLPTDASGGGAVLSLADLVAPVQDSDNENAVLAGGVLRKGNGLMLVSLSGQGKSSFTIQAALQFAMGKPAFGLVPARKLKIAIVQSEDDPEEVAFFRDQIIGGICETEHASQDELETAAATVLLPDATGKAGEAFTSWLDGFLRGHADVDLVVINPLLAYAGCDIANPAQVGNFLRVQLDPVIKGRCAVMIAHHTAKPGNARDRGANWGLGGFSQYFGSGGHEITNWARAILNLVPCENAPGVFALHGAKRGGRLGWHDSDGNPTLTKFIAHSANRIYWRDADPEEVERASANDTQRPRRSFTREQIGGCFTEQEQPYADALTSIKTRLGIGTNKAKEILSEAIHGGIVLGRTEGRKTLYRLKADMV